MKKISFVFIFLMLMSHVIGQNNKVLILIDIQEFYFAGGALPLHEPDKAAKQASEALKLFRENGWPVVHVQHAFGIGGELHTLVAPMKDEVVITKKEVNAFLGTNLLEVLRTLNAGELVFAGMQTHMCLEAAVRAAKDYGFSCVVLSDACATRDLRFEQVEVPAAQVHASTLSTLNRTYARVISTDVWMAEIEKK